ncbi:MAG TPA: hydrolase [Saprospiraceae bacterium]|jgi:nicotinamidase-related amidase|nr:hydrolase [Saprospiraceae bacterium]HMW74998.1 hydrolase [Saprospiraceae bacterium]HMX82182.1 hydrolase [Saprospiraceae bacterium]HMZ73123.1 hydrolase [Saprospiraceae bacterium]HNA40587.1 hydrolase [Saprospiraceae bacterium]
MSAAFPGVNNSLLLVIDVQDRLMPVIHDGDKTIANIQKLIDGAAILGLDTMITEQYPKGLGNTIAELRFDEKTPVLQKNTFSCMLEQSVITQLSIYKKEHLILCGVESHICVLKTAIDAVSHGFTVHVVADAVSSRSPESKQLAFDRMRQSGVFIVSLEMILFMLLDCAGTEEFKAISKLIK